MCSRLCELVVRSVDFFRQNVIYVGFNFKFAKHNMHDGEKKIFFITPL